VAPLAVSAAPVPVQLVVIVLGAGLVLGARPFSRLVADENAEPGSRLHDVIRRATQAAMAGMGAVWIAVGVAGLVINVVG